VAGGSAAMNPEERPSKRDAFLAFFGEGWVSIHLDARREGVEVPDEFEDNRHLVLQYGQNMPIPIHDLDVNEKGVTATLSFSRTPYRTFVPWSAVYIVACNDGRGILYYEDVPEDVSLVARPIDAKTGEPLEAAVLEGGADLHVEDDVDDDDTIEAVGDDEPVAAGAEGDTKRPAPRGRNKKRERLLKSVPADVVDNDGGQPLDEPAAARRRKRPQLRVVK
jgi:stringent starvation protein B